MSLIVLVPLVASMNAIEIPWFTWPVFVLPVVRRGVGDVLFQIK